MKKYYINGVEVSQVTFEYYVSSRLLQMLHRLRLNHYCDLEDLKFEYEIKN
jgi:hypothetical protein